MRSEGVEPTHLSALEPKSSASANFATNALLKQRAVSRNCTGLPSWLARRAIC